MQTWKNAQGKNIGTLKGDLFFKNVKTENILRIMDAWGIGENIIQSLPAKTNITLNDETGKEWKCTREDYLEHGVKREFGAHGPQRFLSRNYFNQDKTLF